MVPMVVSTTSVTSVTSVTFLNDGNVCVEFIERYSLQKLFSVFVDRIMVGDYSCDDI